MSTIRTKRMKGALSTPQPFFHMKFDETGTITTVRDYINGSILTPSSATVDGNGIQIDSALSGYEITGVPLPRILPDENALLIASFKLGNHSLSGNIQYGSNTNNVAVIGGDAVSASSSSGNVGAVSLTAKGASEVGSDFGVGLLIDRQNGLMRGFDDGLDGTMVERGESSQLVTNNWDGSDIPAELYLSGAVGSDPDLTMYNLILYKWTGSIPSDLVTGLQYYADNPKNGIKTRYFGWG